MTDDEREMREFARNLLGLEPDSPPESADALELDQATARRLFTGTTD